MNDSDMEELAELILSTDRLMVDESKARYIGYGYSHGHCYTCLTCGCFIYENYLSENDTCPDCGTVIKKQHE